MALREMNGESTFIYVSVPYRARHRWKKVKVTKGYKYDCGYGFWIGEKHPVFCKNLKRFGIKKTPNLRNDITRGRR